MFGRRHILFRLPFIVLWTVFVILILYKSIIPIYLKSDNLSSDLDQQATRWTTQDGPFQDQLKFANELERSTNQLLIVSNKVTARVRADTDRDATKYLEKNGNTSEMGIAQPLTTTRRSPARDYARLSEVFILLIRGDDFMDWAHRPKGATKVSDGFYPSDQIGFKATKDTNMHKVIVPGHIRTLIEILKYHRIDYSLDVMRAGVPSELLQNPKKYSVIVIDDFARYDRLNRWARDQLDRLCRYNGIGMLTYLIDDGRPSSVYSADHAASDYRSSRRESSAPTNFETLSDKLKATTKQYPISFESRKLDCRNMTSITCLVDYQVNDKAQMLRMVKSKPDFILRGDLPSILKATSLVTMTSNHATHEPLTWARLRSPARQSSDELIARRQAGRNVTKLADRVHSTSDSARQRRAVLPRSDLAPSGDVDDPKVDKEQDVFLAAQKSSDENSEELQLDDDPARYADDKEDISELDFAKDTFDALDKNEELGDKQVIAMLDNGLYDDIRRVIFGVSNQHWLNRLLLLDAIEHLSSGQILTPLERYIQIDIDDIFVGSTGTKMNASDVSALMKAQDYFAQLLDGGFKFNLGFSGKYYQKGNAAEQLGDAELVRNSDKFTWFCHFWSHSKAHLFNSSETLSLELRRNLKFAHDNKLMLIGHSEPPREGQHPNDDSSPLPPTYAVAPHHSGVYPIHEELYKAWRSVLNVQVTSTEEYPHLRTANQRRGFVHETIKVLPRQTCGLYTHTIFKSRYPGGFGKLLSGIKGGELFESVVHNPVNIYMTHMSNYANDRLGLFTFRTLFEFVQKHTNLRLKYSSSSSLVDDEGQHEDNRIRLGGPMFLADYYFRLHPEEREPVWTNPCDDKRHLAIWSAKKLKLCETVPSLLIVGPQKTGTTALQTFLLLNPSMRTSSISSEDFEEVQFFNDKHYFRGSDWYFERFQNGAHDNNGMADLMYMDKSATYFDDPKAPRRASSLLPNAYIALLLINPADRAYSWYQHIRAHGDPIANQFSFDEVIMFQNISDISGFPSAGLNDTSSSSSSTSSSRLLTSSQMNAMKALRSRCLYPGHYSNHLLKWLNYYPSRQVIIIDGEWFRLNPKAVMNRLQLVLRLPKQVDYGKLLVLNRSKGFYCARTSPAEQGARRIRGNLIDGNRLEEDSIKCLGVGKGRKYKAMSVGARNYLEDHYLSHNRQLARLLYEIGQPLPRWLDRSINPLPTTARLL